MSEMWDGSGFGERLAEGTPAIAAAYQEQRMAFRPQWKPSSMPWIDCDPRRREVLQLAWSRGDLDYLLTPSQRRTNAKMDAWSSSIKRTGRIYVLDSSRRWGKSRLLLSRALRFGALNRNWRMIYFGPIKKEVLKIVHPLMAELTQDCPPGLLGAKHGPDWSKSEETFHFRSGSRLEVIGLDVNPDGARGTGIDKGFGDECAFFDNLDYLIGSIIMPQMMGRKHARLELASTPPVSPSHYWSSDLVPDAVNDGAHDLRTLEDADQYPVEEIEEFIRLAGGRNSTKCQREYFCQHITDETLAVIPEFRQVEKEIVKEAEPPPWRFCFEAMDPGWKDNTAVLFGYWDFEKQQCVVEDEICAARLNSADIAAEIKRKELFLWKNVKRKAGNKLESQPYLRVTDHDPRLQQDLAMTHGLVFQPTLKDDIEQQVNAVRVAMGRKQIIIHPRCTKLQSHLRNAVWKKQDSRVFAWEGKDKGHFDTLAALVYLWRAMQQHARRNPYPVEYARVQQDKHSQQVGRPQGPVQSKWTYHGGKFRVR